MQITPVAEVLASEGLSDPVLSALEPNHNNYTVLLMQPRGQIEASTAGVRNRDRELARRQFARILPDAQHTQADLVITPEYSFPWETLVAAIKEGTVPGQGKLWALGCESIKYNELETLKQDLAPFATVLYEPLQPDPTRFTDPLAYVFVAPPIAGSGAATLVVLVQFKTHPMGDDDHFEIKGLQLGTRIYQFGSIGRTIRLVSLICSDAFAFLDPEAGVTYDRALIVHVQLNPAPRQTQFRQYRDRLFTFAGDQTELICVNWARNVCEWCGEHEKPWNNIAASAWYLKSKQFDDRDATLCANHRRGLYYTWLDSLCSHALFFNYEPATYLLEATKVAHIGVPGPISRRRGPQLTKTSVWNDAATAWIEQVAAEDGFAAIVGESDHAKDEIERIAEGNPLEAERVLALCAGKVGHGDDWHRVQRLDSCVIDLSEVVRRITFAQDTDPRARDFRTAMLRRCGRLWDVLKTDHRLPPALADFKQGFRFKWSPDFPHQNAISSNGQRATVIYMGEDFSASRSEETAKTVAECLHRGFANSGDSRLAKQRLAVWFRDGHDNITLCDPHRYVQIDQTNDTSEFDIARET